MSAASAPRRLRFELDHDPAAVMPQVEGIEEFLVDAGCAAAAAQQLTIVAEEVLTNIAREAWPGRDDGVCHVDVDVVADDAGLLVTLRTEDDGVAFDPTAAEEPDTEAALEDREIGGLGILLVRSMTDTQDYQRRDGKNVLTLTKRCAVAR